MKQAEKSERTYQRIIHSAMIEFGTKSYNFASLNTICKENHISKGLLYHHFENKDQLYLRCVQICFDDLIEYMQSYVYDYKNVEEGIQTIFERRKDFFKNHPYHSYLFFQTLFQPPQHLKKDIQLIRKPFNQWNISCYERILQSVSLKVGYTHQDALECFQTLGEMVQAYDQNHINIDNDLTSAIVSHEKRLYKMLKIMLYGIVKESE